MAVEYMKHSGAKDPVQDIAPVSVEEVASSVARIRSMSRAEQETLCDVIFNTQPTLLAHVVVLSRMNVPAEGVDKVLHMLFILYDVFTRATPSGLRQVSEDDLEQADDNHMALFKLLEAEDPTEANRLCQLAAMSHPEVNAFAFVMGEMVQSGMVNVTTREDELCVRVMRNLVDAFAGARRPGAAREALQ